MPIRAYDNKWETPLEKQLEEMQAITKREDYGIRVGD